MTYEIVIPVIVAFAISAVLESIVDPVFKKA